MKRIISLLASLTLFERILWGVSVFSVILSYIISPSGDYLTVIASVIGLSALIFVAKGYVIGQILIVIFSVFYGIISYHFQYYGEMITYLCMSTPIAILAVISWLKNPFGKTKQVRVNRMSPRQILIMLILGIGVSAAFYFILKELGNANLLTSVFSVFTSFIAAYMTFMRSPFYALGYATNDIVLIILWVMASIEDVSYVPMVICFLMFLINDTYGFISWQRMAKHQAMFYDEDL